MWGGFAQIACLALWVAWSRRFLRLYNDKCQYSAIEKLYAKALLSRERLLERAVLGNVTFCIFRLRVLVHYSDHPIVAMDDVMDIYLQMLSNIDTGSWVTHEALARMLIINSNRQNGEEPRLNDEALYTLMRLGGDKRDEPAVIDKLEKLLATLKLPCVYDASTAMSDTMILLCCGHRHARLAMGIALAKAQREIAALDIGKNVTREFPHGVLLPIYFCNDDNTITKCIVGGSIADV